LCPAITETGSLPAEQNPDSGMNHRISGIICKSTADRVFQSEQDTSGKRTVCLFATIQNQLKRRKKDDKNGNIPVFKKCAG
jgi:hypothetical protein